MKSFTLKKVVCLPVFALCLIYSYPAAGQATWNKLTDTLQLIVKKDSLPGLAAVLVNERGILYKKGFGYADQENHQPYTIHSVQNVGSVSKTFLAVALMKAIELKYFTMETNINTLLPFRVVNPYHPSHVITIRELATHISGILDNSVIYPNTYRFHLQARPYSTTLLPLLDQMGYQQKIKDSTMKEFFYNYLSPDGKYYSKENFINDSQGSTSAYSNIASALVAYLIEIKSGLSYADFTNKYILKPLHMSHSGWFTSSLKRSTQAKLYYNQSLYFPLYDLLTYPDGGLKTSAKDLSLFLIDMINGLQGKSVVLTPESFKMMFTPQFSIEHPPANINLTKRNKGILWNVYANGTIGHDGDDPGISAYLFFNPSTSLGGLFLCNKYISDKDSIVKALLESIN